MTIEESQDTTVIAEPILNDRIKSSISIIQSVFAFVLSLGAILTATGFIIVNSYLVRFGTIQGFSVITGRYVSATLWFLLLFIIMFGYAIVIGLIFRRTRIGGILKWLAVLGLFMKIIIELITNPITLSIEVQTIISLLFIHGAIALFEIFGADEEEQTPLDYGRIPKERPRLYAILTVLEPIIPSITRLAKWGNRLIALAFGWILVMRIFTDVFYPSLPQYLGGGQPLPVELILKQSEITDYLPLSWITGTRRTQPILILSELNDGLLVHDVLLNKTMIIKDEFIGAIVDVSIPTAISGTSTSP